MKNALSLAALFALLLGAVDVSAEAADLGKIRLGSHVTGPEITKDDLKGRFVIVEYWGVNCPPCIASIPGITALAEDYGHDKLIVVAMHKQGGSNDKVKEVWEGKAKSEHVAVMNGGDLPGFGNGAIPNAILFDPYGRELYRGSPGGLKGKLKEAVKNFKPRKQKKQDQAPALPPIVTGICAEHFEREVELINERSRSVGPTLLKLRRAVERSSKQEQRDEAAAVVEAVTAWAESSIAQARLDKTSDPATAYATAEQMTDFLGRDELAKPFAELKQAMDADKELMDLVRSTRKLRATIAEAEELGLSAEAGGEAVSLSSKARRGLTRDLRQIIKAWPQTDAAERAAELLKQWGLE